jgi:hypothetical protein
VPPRVNDSIPRNLQSRQRRSVRCLSTRPLHMHHADPLSPGSSGAGTLKLVILPCNSLDPTLSDFALFPQPVKFGFRFLSGPTPLKLLPSWATNHLCGRHPDLINFLIHLFPREKQHHHSAGCTGRVIATEIQSLHTEIKLPVYVAFQLGANFQFHMPD